MQFTVPSATRVSDVQTSARALAAAVMAGIRRGNMKNVNRLIFCYSYKTINEFLDGNNFI
tara:strand:+ start:250 stop:429 length:180 start_codon:yes stop_codon:yes gene_type:complete